MQIRGDCDRAVRGDPTNDLSSAPFTCIGLDTNNGPFIFHALDYEVYVRENARLLGTCRRSHWQI